ncbi:hypothetical protein M407DRAFT_22567 [Tulasnella calospora MUT 4182]|uniref:WW domain-containing protein n=1 Tax=Tulasnella calospora MUT 4182 TaxID=1051891 RepID=A0A0C3QL40_9AGAM|nr:hypothetical protein M407DRAFT_22567 [Tulasnella calospora MUT 4182]
MAHDDEELDWGEDDGWASEQVVATMDVDRPDLIHAGGDGGASQQTLDDDDSPHVPEKVGVSQEPKADVSPTHPATRNGGFERKDSRRTPSRSSSDFGKALPPSLPQRPTTIAPHVEESDPLAASAMARSPSKSTNGLPPDWEERKSRSNGQTYFFNLKTEETTWTKPTVPTAVSSTTPGPTRPDSPSTLRREKERRGPTSPSVPSTLPPPPFSLPARPQTFNSSQQRRDRSASPPPRARSRERQKEPGRDSRGVRGDRRPAGQPPPRTRDVQMRDPSPEPPRRYRSPSPQAARDRGKAGASRVYNERDRSPPPAARGQRPSSPPPRRDDRGPRRPEDRYPPSTSSFLQIITFPLHGRPSSQKIARSVQLLRTTRWPRHRNHYSRWLLPLSTSLR